MTRKRVFVSFDFDNDNELRGNLIAQAKMPDSPFGLTDCSVKAPIDEKWKREVRDRIRSADLMIVICGEHTHDAAGVAAEVTIAREEDILYFLLKGHPDKTCTKPRMARDSDKIYKWTWPNLRKLIAGQR